MVGSAEIWLSKSIFYIKSHPNLSDFFSLKNTNLGTHILLLTFLTTLTFKSRFFLKWCPIFDRSPLLQFWKFHNFIWLQLICSQRNSNFLSLSWKLHNQYCHSENATKQRERISFSPFNNNYCLKINKNHPNIKKIKVIEVRCREKLIFF